VATLTVTPSYPRVGEAILITGDGFTPSAEIAVSIDPVGVYSEIMADGAGIFGSDDPADRAFAVLTTTGNAVAAETVVIGSKTYTWRASIGATANEVLVGASAAASLANLKAAVNLEAGSGTLYGSATTINAEATASVITATTLRFYAKTAGTAGNSIASTDTMTNANFGGATFAGGAAATGVRSIEYRATSPIKLIVTATDGTNTVTTSVYVWGP
jgi:hypothetical protein